MSNSELDTKTRTQGFIATTPEPGQLTAIQPPADYTGLIPADEWCATHGITGTKAAVISDLQRQKASLDLPYIVAVGKLIIDLREQLQGQQYEECIERVLGVGRTQAATYAKIHLLNQNLAEFSQASIEAMSLKALAALETSRKSYELTQEQKRLIIEEAERRARDQEKLLTERTINDLKATLKEQAIDEARNGVQGLLDDQTGQINTQKEKITTLLNQVQELRARMGTSATAAEVANAAMAKPVEGSVTDRATPSLTMLKGEAGKPELAKAEVATVTRWLAEKRKRIEQDIKEFDEIYGRIQKQSQNRHRSYNLFWEGVDLVWKDLPGTTAWKEAYGPSGDRAKALQNFAVKVTELGHKLNALDKQTHYREGEFRVVE